MSDEGFFKSELDGLKLYAKCWKPRADQELRGLVLLAHGYMEHLGRYEKLGPVLADKGIAVYSMDHRGHGKSQDEQKKRAYWKDFSSVIKDFALYADKVRSAYASDTPPSSMSDVLSAIPSTGKPKLPILVFGHSMGGLIATNYMYDYGKDIGYKGLVLSAPFFEMGEPVNSFVAGLNSLVSKICPKLGVGSLPDKYITSDPEQVKLYSKDKLVTREAISAHVLNQFLAYHRTTAARYPELKSPLLLLHGTADKITGPSGSQRCYNLCSSTDRTYSKYEGGYHELLHEKPEMSKRFIDEVVEWIEKRL